MDAAIERVQKNEVTAVNPYDINLKKKKANQRNRNSVCDDLKCIAIINLLKTMNTPNLDKLKCCDVKMKFQSIINKDG